MGNLLYKTLAGASPEGLPRVYFCTHPADRPAFLDITARELFAVQNCSLWYDTDPDHPLPDRDWQLELNQMQLFVVTVTARFLYEDCRARLVELPFALEQHIPVMPILREPGLAEDFSRLCGTVQALDPCTQDPTALPYPAKLHAFLESVLIGDELTAQVRQAFDAYIFLSYRKKDRQEARELMWQIHEEPFCRDVAIWYDEFLTAGEDFNRSIVEALQKSRLFAMVVTPHLNEEQNYVQRVEYPLARETGKAVMPVEMAATDRGELEKHFAGLPPCVSGQDKAALSEMLLKNLRDLALRPRPEDPRHDYFIGLAYLGGIDVEVNPDRRVWPGLAGAPVCPLAGRPGRGLSGPRRRRPVPLCPVLAGIGLAAPAGRRHHHLGDPGPGMPRHSGLHPQSGPCPAGTAAPSCRGKVLSFR